MYPDDLGQLRQPRNHHGRRASDQLYRHDESCTGGGAGMKPTDAELIRAAFKARSFAYTPYSHFKVGAALLAKNGMVYTGCNIENAGYTPTNCAERTALFKAVSEGVTEFTDIAIVGSLDGKKNTLVTGPCGVCRQALYEFCGPRLRVLMAKSEDDYIETTLGDLLPYGFGPTNLEIEPGAD
ncbi:MAG: cytidine deaminase [Subdoligranulum sp.]|uniref:cytidine deaminase n=2 Tax=Clostridia TaxID=186801 RepID=UPI003A45ABCB